MVPRDLLELTWSNLLSYVTLKWRSFLALINISTNVPLVRIFDSQVIRLISKIYSQSMHIYICGLTSGIVSK